MATGFPVDHREHLLDGVARLAQECSILDSPFEAVGHKALLADFLAVCADRMKAGQHRHSDRLTRACDAFLRGGLEALAERPWGGRNVWLQLGVRPSRDLARRGELFRQTAHLVNRLLSASVADNFFFMHKPPGLRLRFQASEAGRLRDLREVVQAELARWRAEQLIDDIEPAVYEPEAQLFGGPRSMPFVHALFTIDSLIWLDYHACRAPEGGALTPAWLVSFAVLRSLFAGLEIVGWEDLAVWDTVRRLGRRRLGSVELSLPAYEDVASNVRDVWSQRDRVLDYLQPAIRATVVAHEPALLQGATQWRSGYFGQPGASIGPRGAAAFFVVFHWNRGGLSPTEQALVTESLAEGLFDDVHG